MRARILALSLLPPLLSCASAPEESPPPPPEAEAAAEPSPSDRIRAATAAIDDERLRNADADVDNRLTHGRTYAEQRYSPLAQVDEASVSELGLAWSFEMGTSRGVESTPLVVDGTLYATGPWSVVYALDAATGEIIDRRHPLSGEIAAGKILVIPFTRGSSTTTAVLLESVKTGTVPAGFITSRTDSFLSLASIVADEMYGKPIPIIAVGRDEFEQIDSGQTVQLATDGTIHIRDYKST